MTLFPRTFWVKSLQGNWHIYLPAQLRCSLLKVSRVTLSKVLNGKAGITAEIALRLSAWLSTSPDVWLGMQTQWDLWQAKQQPNPKINPLERLAA